MASAKTKTIYNKLRGKLVETIYKFSAYNTESIYGFGTTNEAAQYLECLNQNREINKFEMEISGLSDEQAENLAINLSDNRID